MRDFVYIDEVPVDEPCAQVGSSNYYPLAMIEIRAHKNQLMRQHGPPPDSSFFKTHPNAHDSGTYYTLIYVYDDEIDSHVKYACLMEDCAMKWDTVAIVEIIEANPRYFEMVEESNKITSPRLNAFMKQVMEIINS